MRGAGRAVLHGRHGDVYGMILWAFVMSLGISLVTKIPLVENSHLPRSRHSVRFRERPRPLGCNCRWLNTKKGWTHQNRRRISRGLSRMRQLPSMGKRSGRHLPFQYPSTNISRHPRVPSAPRSAHPPRPYTPLLSLFCVPRHASFPLRFFFPVVQTAVKGQATGTKVNQKVSLFSPPLSHSILCGLCSPKSSCVSSWPRAR